MYRTWRYNCALFTYFFLLSDLKLKGLAGIFSDEIATCTDVPLFLFSYTWALAGMGKGRALAPTPWNSCKVFLSISNDGKTLSKRIIYALFSKHSSASGAFALRPHRGSAYGRHWRTEASDPLICPPLKKNPAGAHVLTWNYVHTNVTGIVTEATHGWRVGEWSGRSTIRLLLLAWAKTTWHHITSWATAVRMSGARGRRAVGSESYPGGSIVHLGWLFYQQSITPITETERSRAPQRMLIADSVVI